MVRKQRCNLWRNSIFLHNPGNHHREQRRIVLRRCRQQRWISHQQHRDTYGDCRLVQRGPPGANRSDGNGVFIQRHRLELDAPTPPANCTISSYTIYGGTTANPTTVIASGVTGTTYSNTGLAASTTYYYLVKAVDADGTSPTSNQASTETLVASGGTSLVSIDAGGAAVSDSGGGDNSFVADEDYTGGSTYSVTSTITIPSSVSATAAPAAVYQSARQGNSTYTIPGLTSGSSYNVLLHFAETYFSAAASREFNVVINGTTVLTNFDIYATAGARTRRWLKQYTATANSSGEIVIAFSQWARKDQPMVNGIEVLSTSGGIAPPCLRRQPSSRRRPLPQARSA